jgi:UDP-glucose 4-epimerase
VRVVITGATGNLGTSLVETLSIDPKVDSITGIARRAPEWSPPKTTWVEADIRSAPLLEHFDGADAVINLAWMFQPTHGPLTTWENNVRGGERVFEAAAASGAGVLMHASSVGAYRAREGQQHCDEQWPTDALCTAAYGREKSYLERVLDRVSCHHPLLRVVRMRPCFLFKRGASAAQRRIFGGPLVPRSLLKLRAGTVPVPSGLRFQAMHTSDAAEAFRLALHAPVRGAFNLAADPPIGPEELAAALGGRPLPVPLPLLRTAVSAAWHARLLPASPHLVDLVAGLPLLDTSLARSELGWAPRMTGPEALGEMLEGMRSGSSFPTPPLQDDQPARWDEVVSLSRQFASSSHH